MATTRVPTSRLDAPHPAARVDAGPKPSPPVKLWAAAGAVSWSVILYAWGRWVTSSDFTRTPNGPDPFTGWHARAVDVIGVLSVVGALGLGWQFVLKPILRDRRMSLDGMLLLSAVGMWFYDPLDNMFNLTFLYNTHFFQFGSWVQWIPGWSAANTTHFVQPITFTLGAYVWFLFGFPLLGCLVLRRLRSRFPTASILSLFGGLFVFFLALDAVVEITMVRTEVYAYAGIPRHLALWAGRYDQFPIYEPILVAGLMMGLTAIHWFRDDRGRAFVERGLDDLRCAPRSRRAVTFLAVCGFTHAWYLVSYFVPYNVMALKADTFPALPSYMRQGICGAGTDYACPSRYVPIPKDGSLHVTPDDPRLPQRVRDRQGVRPPG